MVKRWRVDLTEPERTTLQALISKGTASARKLRRARTLLLAAEGHTDATIAQMLHSSVPTVERTRKRCVQEGPVAVLTERPRPGGQCKLDGGQEAHLIALTCSAPPAGRAHWTLRLLANELVALDIIESISYETVRRTLKKTN
jgi:transposase